jgi:hypothetical protein
MPLLDMQGPRSVKCGFYPIVCLVDLLQSLTVTPMDKKRKTHRVHFFCLNYQIILEAMIP